MKRSIKPVLCAILFLSFTSNIWSMRRFLQNYCDPFKLTLKEQLMEAARCGDLEILKALFYQQQNTIDPDTKKSHETRTPLATSIIQKHFKSALFLLDQGAQVQLVDSEHQASALHWLAQANDRKDTLKLAKKILSNNKDILESSDKYGSTALAISVYHGYPELTDFLLKSGASLNLPHKGDPLEYFAYKYSNAETLQLLLAKGLQIYPIDAYGQPFWHGAFDNVQYKEDLLQTLVTHEGVKFLRALTKLDNKKYYGIDIFIKNCIITKYHVTYRADAIAQHMKKTTKRKSKLKVENVTQLLEELKGDTPLLCIILEYALGRGHLGTIKTLIPHIITNQKIIRFLQKKFKLTAPCRRSPNKKSVQQQFVYDVKKFVMQHGDEQAIYNVLAREASPESYAVQAIKDNNKILMQITLPLLDFGCDDIFNFFGKTIETDYFMEKQEKKYISFKTLYQKARNAQSKMAGKEIVTFAHNFLIVYCGLKKQHEKNMSMKKFSTEKRQYKKNKYWTQMYLAANFQKEKLSTVVKNILSYTAI